MKMKITLLLVVLLFSQITCTTTSAQTKQTTDKQTIYFEDGSYTITFIADVAPDASSDIDVNLHNYNYEKIYFFYKH